MDAAGAWTLWVNDNASADTGTLVAWSLFIESPGGELAPCEEAFPVQCNEGDDDDDDDDDDGAGWWTD
jgi:subtilisin-like proprotein convertase family protein